MGERHLILLNERGKEMIRRLETFDTDITRLENVASGNTLESLKKKTPSPLKTSFTP